MNFIAAIILLNVPDEEDSFWCFVYVMLSKNGLKTPLGTINGKHNWRKVFIDGMPKAIDLDKKLRKAIKKKAGGALERILEETDGLSLYPAFGSLYISIFIVDLPDSTSSRLFEAFLLQGEKFMLNLISSAVRHK